MINKEIISYSEYSDLLDELVDKIKSSLLFKEIKFIYTFMRGGLPIAVHLSHFLGKPVYTDETKIDFLNARNNSVLVVDDISDTGKTLDGLHILYPTATLFYKPGSKVKPTFYVRETTNWIVFPFEMVDEKPNR